jgi:twitching motility protein PilT
MVNNGRTAERILDPDRTSEIEEIIAEGSFYGMQTFDQSLLGLVMKRLVTTEEALHSSTNPHDFMLALEQAGETVPA